MCIRDRYLRRGIEAGLEVKAIGNSSDSIGGYAVPQEIDEQIDITLNAISPIRSIANVVKVGSAGYRKLIASGGTPSGWVGFEADRPETGTPDFTEIVPASGELYASLSIAFGNFKAGYVIAERNATTILRDPYTHKPYVHFYATKRVGGQVVNSEAIKLLQFG